MKRLLHPILIVCGWISVALGLIGTFLPLIPTTPFLLLAAYCFARSSERFYNWLLSNRIFGPTIRSYREGHGLTVRQKATTLTVMWLVYGITLVFFVPSWYGRVPMILLGVGVTTYLVRLPTRKEG